MQNKINLSAEATRVIEALQHKNGTYDYYRKTLSRIHTYVLHQSDEIGMSDTETLHTLRALDAISLDLAALAGPAATGTTSPDSPAEIAGKVEVFTMEHVDFSSQEEEAEVKQTPAEITATLLESAAGTLRDGRETIIAAMSAAELAGAGAAFHKRVLELDVMLEGFIAKINKLRDYAPLLEDAADENSEKGGE